jgi:hypothetical protein
MLQAALTLAGEGYADQKTANSALRPERPPTQLCDARPDQEHSCAWQMRSWAQHVAINMPSQYLCNVSGLPERDAAWNHPGLQGENLQDFSCGLPPRTQSTHPSLFLYGFPM